MAEEVVRQSLPEDLHTVEGPIVTRLTRFLKHTQTLFMDIC